MSEAKTFINIENIAATTTLKQKIELLEIVRIFPNVEYRPEQFPGLVFRLKKPKNIKISTGRV